MITRIDRALLRRIAKHAVLQGAHRQEIKEVYKILIQAAREEFVEDTKPTLHAFLRECHEEALNEA